VSVWFFFFFWKEKGNSKKVGDKNFLHTQICTF
jgi:hypothetical protein